MAADRVHPLTPQLYNPCPRLKCFVWAAGGGAEGQRGGAAGVNTTIHIHAGEG